MGETRRNQVNAERRKALAEAISHIEEAKSIIETAATEERDEFEALSEKAQEADKGVAIEACASSLEEMMDTCDDLVSKLNDAKV
jgi:predicted  nucleic acid-binding Zn-ribbon protein